jgi:hypothetical protein
MVQDQHPIKNEQLKMNMRNRIMLLLLLAAVWTCQSIQAQVTMGGGTPPKAGAILDLNSTTKGGLLLSNVDITDLGKIPVGTTIFPGITAGMKNREPKSTRVWTSSFETNNNPTIVYFHWAVFVGQTANNSKYIRLARRF